MPISIVVLIVIIAIVVILQAIAKSKTAKSPKKALAKLGELNGLTRRAPLTKREKEMYLALTSALPACAVLAQVAFSALVTTKNKATRNRFDRKVADFVICSKQLDVIAVVELDDATHKNKVAADEERDAMLKNAGYVTIRYKNVPDENTIRKDIVALLVAKKEVLAA
ncbi:MAG: DUF2726 domain-containing protein [Pseudomonadota bacterium]